jgi:hypothetical protein
MKRNDVVVLALLTTLTGVGLVFLASILYTKTLIQRVIAKQEEASTMVAA